MSVGLLLITHTAVGQALLEVAITVVGASPMSVEILEAGVECQLEEIEVAAKKYLEKIDQGQGVLILTDLYGSTPSNIAAQLCADNIRVISGLNLPMLIRVFNYPDQELDVLAEKAFEAGKTGILKVADAHDRT